MLFYARPEVQGEIRRRLKDLTEVKININSQGSTIVLYNPPRP